MPDVFGDPRFQRERCTYCGGLCTLEQMRDFQLVRIRDSHIAEIRACLECGRKPWPGFMVRVWPEGRPHGA